MSLALLAKLKNDNAVGFLKLLTEIALNLENNCL